MCGGARGWHCRQWRKASLPDGPAGQHADELELRQLLDRQRRLSALAHPVRPDREDGGRRRPEAVEPDYQPALLLDELGEGRDLDPAGPARVQRVRQRRCVAHGRVRG